MKSRQSTPEYQDLENQPGLANYASQDSGSKSSTSKRPKRKSRVLRERQQQDMCDTHKIEEREVLFDITVEVEDGREVHIQMKEGDSAEQIASKFCHDQNLPSQLVLPLTEHINKISNFNDDHCCRYIGPDYGRELEDEYLFSKRRIQKESGKYTSRRFHSRPERPFKHERKPKKDLKRKQRAFSERLMSCTFTSAAKLIPQPPKKKKKVVVRLSDKQRALCARLHAEYELYHRRREEERRSYEDFHEQQLKKKRLVFSKGSRKIMKVRELAAKHFQNYGELLYREAILAIQHREKIYESRQKELKESEMEGVTGSPAISKLARNLKRKAGEVWERLQSTRRSESRLQSLREQTADLEVMECTFKPRVNSSGPDIKEISHGTVSRFDLLFWDAESRKKRQEKYMLWYPDGITFRPEVNRPCCQEPESRPDSASSAYSKIKKASREPSVFSRLLDYAARLTGRRQKEREEELVDPSTGQKLFTPLTGRGPRNIKRNEKSLPIGEFLYNLDVAARAKKEALEENINRVWINLSNHHYALKKSEILAVRFEQRNFQQLFGYLDDDKDGYVELATAETKDLKEDVALNIAEARKMGSEAERPLPFQKFVDLMLTVQRKRKGLHMLLSSWRRKTAERFSFERKMNQKSRKLAARKRDFSSRDQWYKIILSDRQKVQEKIEAMRRQKELKEINQCTFSPAILGGPGKSRFRNPKFVNDVRVQEHGQDDVHGYIIKETQLHGPGPEPTSTAAATTQPENGVGGGSTSTSSGFFNVWKRFVAKPPVEEKLQVTEPVLENSSESSGGDDHFDDPAAFLSGIPEP
ncbi:uncharacterized protein LOC9657376 isoform X2 [Selaginella moellendorffii]|uniref:uncharacterized protein LOC9657376 isoform X2 n=1 Tax=Selaginella moellendorffii TaxID=88036 RepID=UPI000D1CF068|nr:uncharacterized protein LOC9657376 isoform X2 [Selaginella moellendorffii]|eukprot:XP_024534971.1 uncharacterized protein LOC9657376 isoform X2 [Selaginella moellendorffii]